MAAACENGQHGQLGDHSEQVHTCYVCGSTYCESCRVAATSKTDQCPICSGYVGPEASCRRTGGCGK